MIDPFAELISGIILGLLGFILKKVYYINHIVTELKTDMKWVKKDLNELKEFVFSMLNRK